MRPTAHGSYDLRNYVKNVSGQYEEPIAAGMRHLWRRDVLGIFGDAASTEKSVPRLGHLRFLRKSVTA